ncbi:MAG: ATP-binding protein [Deltaproteobacteria bacterium]|nr:ATP-binding protein [Deltaproteobacteria bacterium]
MHFYKERALGEKLKQLFSYFPVVVVSGARQVGKTELVTHLFGDIAKLVTFDPIIDVGAAREDPELFLNSQTTPIILDEIQYVPALTAVIKRKVDQNRVPGQYILTGSQQWEVMKNLSESLAGRAVFLDLDSFSLSEMANLYADKTYRPWLVRWLADRNEIEQNTSPKRIEINLYETLWTGSLPEATSLPRDVITDFHAGYIRTYIERDIRLLLTETDLVKFRKFYQLSSALTAQEINFSEFGRELGADYKVVQKWLSVLQATFQWYEIPAYFNNPVKRIAKKPKGIFSDTGLACHLLGIPKPEIIAGHPMYGRLFESLVIREMMKQLALMRPRPNLYHWRSHKKQEVDLIVECDNRLYPIEIKGKSNPDKNDLSGITAFRQAYPRDRVANGLIISAGERVYALSENDCVVPWNVS